MRNVDSSALDKRRGVNDRCVAVKRLKLVGTNSISSFIVRLHLLYFWSHFATNGDRMTILSVCLFMNDP